MSQLNGFRSINLSAENILEHGPTLYSRQNKVKLFNPFSKSRFYRGIAGKPRNCPSLK